MKATSSHPRISAFTIVLIFVVSGCSQSTKEIAVAATPLPPKVAASQLQQVFRGANTGVQGTAKAAAEALESANYEQAIRSLQAIKARENLTLQQGTAVYNSEMALEARLIAGIQAGDLNAQRAYELLKKSKRN